MIELRLLFDGYNDFQDFLIENHILILNDTISLLLLYH